MIGATTLALLTATVTEWSWGYALEIGAVDLATKLFWAKVQYFGIVTLPVAWLAFSLHYTRRRKWLTRRNVALLSIVPLLTLLLVWTNQAHHLIWQQTEVVETNLFLALNLTYGPWFWVHLAFSSLMLLLGTILLIQALIQSPHLYRRQTIALLVASLTPWAGNFLYLSGLNPLKPLDLTPFAFTVSGLTLSWALFRFRLLDIAPIARKMVVENMKTGVIALDMQDRVVDINPAGETIIGIPASQAIGQPVTQLLKGQSELPQKYRHVLNMQEEIVLGKAGAQRHYELNISPLSNRRNRPTGRLITLYDITQRNRAKARLQRTYDALVQRNYQLAQIAAAGNAFKLNMALEPLLQEIVKAGRLALGFDTVVLNLVDKANRRMRVRAHIGLDDKGRQILENAVYNLTDFTNLMQDKFRYGRCYLIMRQEIDKQHLPKRIHSMNCNAPANIAPGERWSSDTALLIPLETHQNQLIGIISVDCPHNGRRPTLEEMQILEIFANQAAIAIENAQLYEQVQRHNQTLEQQVEIRTAELHRSNETLARRTLEAEALHRFAKLVNSNLDADDVVSTLVTEAARILQVDACAVMLTDQKTKELIFKASTDLLLDNKTGLRMELAQGIAGRVIRLGKTQIIDDVESDPDHYPVVADSTQIKIASMLAAPMTYKDKTLGVIEAICTRPRHFTPDEARILEGIAQSTLTALNNAQLYQHLLDSESKYRDLFENATDFIWTVDREGRFTNANRIAELATGFAKADVIGRPFTHFVLPEQREAVGQAFDKIYTTGQPLIAFPVKIQTPDGRNLDLELSATPLYQQEQMVGLQGIARDITRRLQMERELIRSEKLAAVGQLAAGAAHEVNNPLAIISSTIQLMMYKWDTNNPDRQLMQQVEEEIQRISRILKGLMDFARPNTDQAAPQYLNTLVANFTPLIKGKLEKHNIDLKLQLPSTLPPVIAPEDGLKQVLFNLTSNAIEAMPNGGRLSISVAANSQNVILKVGDTGIGLSPEAENRLFEPFFSTKGVAGNGLGLAMVHGIITDCGGTIKAANNTDAGCTFTITLPAAK